MSQSGIYFDSFAHAVPRYGESAANAHDPLAFRRHETHVAPIYPKKLELSNEGTAALDTEVIYKMPTSGYLSYVAIKNVYSQTTTADYSNYTGMAAIKKVKLEVDGNTLMDYSYNTAIIYYLSKLRDEEARDQVLAAAGGAGPTTTTAAHPTIVPIPLFFDPIMCPGVGPLNLAKFQKAPELKITYRAGTQIRDTGATGMGIDSSRMVLYMSETTPAQKRIHNQSDYWFKSIDLYTNEDNVIPTATATDVDVSGMAGSVKKVMVTMRTAANITANNRFTLANIDVLKTDMDGHIEHQFRTAEEGELDYVIYTKGKSFSSTLGYPYWIPHSFFAEESYATNFVGGIHSAKINKHQINVTQTFAGAADGNFSVLGIRSAIYKYTNGTMERLL